MIYYDSKLKNTARTLRKNMTDAERLLWSRIRRKQLKGYQFYRQRIIGRYIIDFFCPTAKLIVELDGSQHYTQEGMRADKLRDRYLSSFGLRVLRFPSAEVLRNLDGIVEEIYDHLPDKSPWPPLKKGEGRGQDEVDGMPQPGSLLVASRSTR